MTQAFNLSQLANGVDSSGKLDLSTNSKNPSWTTDITANGLTVGKGGGAVGSNTATGASALQANSSGAADVAVGYQSLAGNTSGSNNTALGYQSLVSNSTASNNTAVGYQAGYSNTTGDQSVYIGTQAAYTLTTGTNNTVVGFKSGYSLTTGTGNTFIGNGYNQGSGYSMTTGSRNTIIGGYTGNSGGLDIRTSNNYIVLSDGDGNPRQYFDTNGTTVTNTKNSSGQQIAISRLNLTVGSNTLVAAINGVNNISAASVIFEATVNNSAGNDGYSVARSVREVLISAYGNVATLLKSTELSNNTGSVNTSVINCTVTTSASVSGTTLQLYVNSTQTGVAATSTNTCTYKITIVENNNVSTFTLN